jgi:hypothetical protein
MRILGSKIALLVAALAGAAGCGGAGNKDSDGYVTVCEERALTGSEINRVRCRRKVDVDERRRRDAAFMQKIQNETPRRGIGAGPGGQ